MYPPIGIMKRLEPNQRRASGLRLISTAALCLFASGCGAPPAKSVRFSTENVPGLRPGDIESCAQRMARDILSDPVASPLLQRSSPPVRIALVSIENNTNEPFVGGSRDMITTRMQTILFRALRSANQRVGGTAKFIIQREGVRRFIETQRADKRRGEVTHRGLKDRHGVDFMLSGVYHALDKVVEGIHIVEMIMTFDLTSAEDDEIIWTNDYPIKTLTGA